jgi:putative ABC transport system permease protein
VASMRYAMAAVDMPARVAAKGAPSASGMAAASLLGIDPVEFPMLSTLAFTDGTPGDAFAALSAGRAMIVNPVLAATLGLKPGDLVPLMTPEGRQEYRVAGIATDFLDVKLATAFVSQVDLARDFHVAEDVFLQVDLAKGADAAAAGAAIREIVRDYPQFSVIEGRAYFEQMSALFTAVFAGLYLLFGFFALPSLLTTLNMLAIGVIERTREIGMLRAVGTTQKQVGRVVLAEAVLLALFGTAFGLAAGLYLGYLLVKAMVSMGFPMDWIFPWGGVAAAAVLGLGFGALAAIVPARRAAHLQIVEALRYE